LKQHAGWALAYIAKHSLELAKSIDSSGGISYLIMSIKEPEVNIRIMSLVCLTEIIKHSDEFAHSFIDKGGCETLRQLITNSNVYIKREALSCMAQIAKFKSETAVKIIEDEGSTTFRNIVKCINDADSFVQRNAAVCISEIVKHGQPLLANVNNTCGAAPFIEYAKRTKGYLQMPGLLIIKDVCTFDDGLAKQVIEKGGINLLKEAIENGDTLYMKSCGATAISEIAKKSAANSAALIKEGIPTILINCYKTYKVATTDPASENLASRAEDAIREIISATEDIEFLELMLDTSPIEIHRIVYPKIAKLIAKSVSARKDFAMKGYFKKAMEKEAQADDIYVQSFLKPALMEIKNIYPLEITQFNAPNFIDTAIAKWYNENKQKEAVPSPEKEA
jgi:hypothetical protein